MKITRKHFIKCPFLAVVENYRPSLVDCFFLVLYKLSFKEGLIVLKNMFNEFLDLEIRELPAWCLGVFLVILVFLFYPLSFFALLVVMYCRYATRSGIKKQRQIFSNFKEWEINYEKRRAGWCEL